MRKDGNYEFTGKGLGNDFYFQDIFTTLLEIRWRYLLLAFCLVYFSSWLCKFHLHFPTHWNEYNLPDSWNSFQYSPGFGTPCSTSTVTSLRKTLETPVGPPALQSLEISLGLSCSVWKRSIRQATVTTISRKNASQQSSSSASKYSFFFLDEVILISYLL